MDNKVVAISEIHHEVHEGIYYDVQHSAENVADNGTLIVTFEPLGADTLPMHLTSFLSCGGDFRIEIYEGPTVNTPGTLKTIYNINRESSNITGWKVRTDDTFSNNGTTIFDVIIPGGSGGIAQGGETRIGLERLFARNKIYAIKLTNLAGTQKVLTQIHDWYEEDLV